MNTLLITAEPNEEPKPVKAKKTRSAKGAPSLAAVEAPAQQAEVSTWPIPRDKVQHDGVWVELFSRARLPSRFGDFKIFVFKNSVDDKEHVALVRGAVRDACAVPVRVHSECLTGDVLGSLRCDCREQLESALGSFGQQEAGILLYMRQEGRGIGLGNKVRAYALQEQGLDTFEANQHLGFDDDLRRYDVAALILKMFGPKTVRLLTNNPRKIFGLRAAGIEVCDRESIVVGSNPHNSDYLHSKALSGHFLPIAR